MGELGHKTTEHAEEVNCLSAGDENYGQKEKGEQSKGVVRGEAQWAHQWAGSDLTEKGRPEGSGGAS